MSLSPIVWRMEFPTKAQLDTLVMWINEGAAKLDEPRMPGQRRRHHRNRSVNRIRRLTDALELGQKAHDLRLRSYREPLETHLPGVLRDALYAECRRRGLLTRWNLEAAAPDVQRIPLSAMQLHLLWMMSWGASYITAGRTCGMSRDSVASSLYNARRAHGCASTAQLVATAYRLNWFPDPAEMRELAALRKAAGL